MSETTLRIRAREALRTGRLPNARPEAIWGGPGSGDSCAICAEPIERHQSEFELLFAVRGLDGSPGAAADPSGSHSGDVTCRMHVPCFAAWEFVRQNGHALSGAREERVS